MAINIPILSEFSPKGIERAIKEFQRLETAGQKAQFALQKAAVPAAAALAGLAAIAAVSVKGAIEDAQAQTQLALALRNTVGATQAQIAATEESISAMSRASGIADDQLRPALAAILRGTKDLGEAQKALGLAMNISTATSIDLATVSDALAKAYQGNFRGLRQLSPEMAAMVKDGATLEQVMAVLGQTFGGAVAANANTAAGRMQILRNSLNEAAESFGSALLPVVEAILPSLQKFADWAQANPGRLLAIAKTVGVVAGAIVALNAALKIFQFTTVVATAVGQAFNITLAANPIGLVVLALVAVGAALVAAYMKFEGFRKVVDAVLGFIKVQITRAVDFVKMLLNAYVNAYKAIFNFIVKLWNNTIGRIAFKLPTVDELIGKIRGASDETKQLDLEYRDFLDRQSEGTQAWARDMGNSFETVNESMGGGGKAVETYAQKVKAALGDALTSAKERLKTAADEMAKFGESVKAALLDAFSFRDAAEAGKESGGGFLSGLQAQAKKVTDYASQVQQLLDMGLSKEALQQVLAAGTEAGSAIAAQLIEGGATAIEQTNRLVESARAAADQVGLLAGEKYFGAGVKFAQDVVMGLEEELKKLTPKLMAQMDAIAARMKRTVTVDVKVNEIIQRVESRVGGIPRLAEGGVVTRPTLALIGEAGPEAVIPLSRMGQQQQSGGDTTINIYSTIADQSLPDKLVAALRTYNRTTGPIRIQTV